MAVQPANAALQTTKQSPVTGSGAVAASVSNQPSLAWAQEAMRIDLAQATRKRRIGFSLRMLVWVALPTLLAALYVYAYATPRYLSEFQLTYQSFQQPGSSASALAAGGQSSFLSSILGGATGAVDMSRVIASYLTSSDLIDKVNARVDLRAHYGSAHIDWIDRLPSDASQEQLLAYFQKRVEVDAVMGGYVVVDVEAFDSKTAKAIAEAMSAAADDMVQAISNRALLDEVKLAEKELVRTEDRLLGATLDVTKFRNQHHNFDPQAAAVQLGNVVGGLEGQLSSYRAALSSLRNFVSEDAPAVKALRSQIQATEQEMSAENYRLASAEKPPRGASPSATQPYSETVSEFVRLTEEQQFATDSYTSAKLALDAARTNAANKRAYVESFVNPNAPQQSTAPGGRTVFATFLVALLVYMVGSLLVAALREDAGL